MYLEEVIIDGFKSYATRAVIGPFHPQFNAISGLNGTGKSNILDAICFVMGIKSLHQMRVTKSDELIYKQGQAGITKAGVTLVFRNEDRGRSPLGMADIPKITISRQIAIGGRDRFIMNGHTSRPADIQTIFQSVQLNVNNPHFLVMQGRITKVINMKPPEVLAMVEETAGTRLYEIKRTECARKIATKESKLAEVDSVLQEEIEPTLKTLRQEQEQHTVWLRAKEEYSRLERFCRAYEHFKVITEMKRLSQKKEETLNELTKFEQTLTEAKKSAYDIGLNLHEEAKRQATLADKRIVEDLQEKKKKLEKELTIQSVAAQETKKSQIKLFEDFKQCVKAAEDAQNELAILVNSTSEQREEEEHLQKTITDLNQQIEDRQATLEELRTGAVSQKNKITSRQKLTNAEIQLKQLEAELQQLDVSISQWNKDLTECQTKGNKQSETLLTVREEVTNQQRIIETLQFKRNSLIPKAEELARLKTKYQERMSRLAELEELIDEMRRKTFYITRHHKENPDGIKQGIKGTALELLHINDEDIEFAVALEEAGKSRLFNIVVTNDEVAKRLLEKYKVIRRITCIPLNRIRATKVSDQRLEETKKLLGLSVTSNDIKRPTDILKPIESDYYDSLVYVFGQAYLCKTTKLAQAVAEHPKIKAVAVNLNGDQYNPGGSVSGGSQSGLNGVLLNYRNLLQLLEEEKITKEDVSNIKTQIDSLLSKLQDLQQCECALQSAEVTLDATTKRLKELESLTSETDIKSLQEKLINAKRRCNLLRETEIPQLRNIDIPQLRQTVEGTKENRDTVVKRLDTEVAKFKVELKTAQKALQKFEHSTSNISRRLAVLQEQVEISKRQVVEKETEKNNMEHNLDKIEEIKRIAAQAFKEGEEELDKALDSLKEKGKRFRELEAQKREAELVVEESDAAIVKAQHTLRCVKQNLVDFGKRNNALLRDFPWLQAVESSFNQPGTDFNFNKVSYEDSFDRLETLKRETERLQKKVNKDIMSTLETAEKELQALKEKKNQLLRDKTKLEEFIEELDSKKTSALEQCWQQVDSNFSAIFSTLMPGSDAHLQVLPGEDIKNGLEMKVWLSGVQRASLGELSGGQRSLLALSLVLALLKYKPAPLYILDEIDAALDLSHTQTIGKMIKTQFSGSQFLVVSLKENLFNYADVLFRTAFVNGSSQVKRIYNTEKRDDESNTCNKGNITKLQLQKRSRN